MIYLKDLSVLEFAGGDAATFLHKQLSGDVLVLAEGESGFGCVCNASGRVLGLLLVRRGRDSCLAMCAASLLDGLATHLGRFVLRSDVRIVARPDLRVTGCVEKTEPSPGSELLRTRAGLVYALSTGEPPSDDSADDWKAAELERGVAWLDAATSAQFLPQMLGYEGIGALSFSKGCYPGQEIIARTRYLGKLKRHPFIARLDTAWSPPAMESMDVTCGGAKLQAMVVEHARKRDGTTLLYLVVRGEGLEGQVELQWGDRQAGAEVAAVHLPGSISQGSATT